MSTAYNDCYSTSQVRTSFDDKFLRTLCDRSNSPRVMANMRASKGSVISADINCEMQVTRRGLRRELNPSDFTQGEFFWKGSLTDGICITLSDF